MMRTVLMMLKLLGTVMIGAVPLAFLWNGILVDLVTVIRPISYIQAIGIQFLAALLQQSFNIYYIRGAEPQGEIKQ